MLSSFQAVQIFFIIDVRKDKLQKKQFQIFEGKKIDIPVFTTLYLGNEYKLLFGNLLFIQPVVVFQKKVLLLHAIVF